MATRTFKRRLITNLVLACLAAGLVLVLVFEPGQEPPPEKPTISTLSSEDIHRIAILRPGKPAIRFEKENGRWRMTEPRRLPAAPGKLDDLIAFAETTSERRYRLTEIDPAGLGLADDPLRLVLNDTEFAFGGTDAINGWRYVRVGRTVHMVDGSIYYNLKQDPLSWVALRLLPPKADIKALKLPDVHLVQKDALWQVAGKQKKIDSDAIVKLVKRWKNAHALSVHPLGKNPEYAGTVRVTLSGREQPIVFKIIRRDAGFALARPEWQLKYRLSEFQSKDLLELQSSQSK